MADQPVNWTSRLATWELVEVNYALRPLEPPLTDRPINLTTLADKVTACGPQFVWVTRARSNDPPLPFGIYNMEEMRSGLELVIPLIRFFRIISAKHEEVPY